MGISTKTIERMNYEHKVGPIQIRVGRGCRRYVRREFIAWLESPLADGTLMGRRAWRDFWEARETARSTRRRR